MTPIRAVFASLFAAVIFAAGLFIVSRLEGASPHDLLALLSWTPPSFSLWPFLAAWGAAALGAVGVIGAFLAFITPEDLNDPHHDGRGFPKTAPLFLVLTGLALAAVAFRLAGPQAGVPVAIAIAPEIVPEQGETPAVEPVVSVMTRADADDHVIVAVSSFSWRYMDPLVNDSGAVWGGYAPPFADEGEAAALLCNKAWIAVSGSASEEGPPDRNARRSRFRAELAMSRAERWLARHPECGETYVFGVDLGQHTGTEPEGDDGSATAYQRQILVASRARTGRDGDLGAAGAEAELHDFLDDRRNRAAFFAGRDFPRDPSILTTRTALAADWR